VYTICYSDPETHLVVCCGYYSHADALAELDALEVSDPFTTYWIKKL
jgi:hypothetical protein